MAIKHQLRPILARLLHAAEDALTTKPGRVLVMPGAEVVHDDCCDGQLWTRVIQIEPVTLRNIQTRCGIVAFQATIGVGIVRCAATIDDNGNAPSEAEMTADAFQVSDDAEEIGNALSCSKDIQALLLWTPSGPLGGCVGGEWQVSARFDICACPEAHTEQPGDD